MSTFQPKQLMPGPEMPYQEPLRFRCCWQPTVGECCRSLLFTSTSQQQSALPLVTGRVLRMRVPSICGAGDTSRRINVRIYAIARTGDDVAIVVSSQVVSSVVNVAKYAAALVGAATHPFQAMTNGLRTALSLQVPRARLFAFVTMPTVSVSQAYR